MNLEDIRARFDGVRGGRGRWTARCPAHDDRRPSLSIRVADDGKILLHCHAGCSIDAICQEIGIEKKDLFAAAAGPEPSHRSTTKTFLTPEAAALAAEQFVRAKKGSDWRLLRSYSYTGKLGADVMRVLRFESANGSEKTFRPIHPVDGGWAFGDPPCALPVYRLAELDGASLVFICEGEKAADAAAALDIAVTTNAHGANSAAKTDWSPVEGIDVVILPDNDQPGRNWASTVAALSIEADAASVKVVELPGLPDHGDIVEFIEHRRSIGQANEQILTELHALVADAPVYVCPSATDAAKTSRRGREYRPFPTSALPEPIRTFVREAAEAIGCFPASIVLPLLATIAAAIGNTRRIRLKSTWQEPAVVWTVTIGDSGSLKSPGLDAAVRSVRELQRKAIQRQERAEREHLKRMLRHDVDVRQWKKAAQKGSDVDPPKEPEAPVSERYYCSDTTVEALAEILQHSPRGVLLLRDELAGWLRSFNQYRGGKGADTAHWLEMHGARPLMVDRKTGSQKTIFVPAAAVSLTGGIQPGTFKACLGVEHFENGMAARLLVAYPPRKARRWNEAEIPVEVEIAMDALFERLYQLEPQRIRDDEDEVQRPVTVDMTADAKRLWIRFYNEHAEEQLDLVAEEAAAWSKLEGYVARFSLIFYLVREANGESETGGKVEEQDVAAAIEVVRWFGAETKRVYAVLSESDAEEWLRQRGEAIRARGGAVSTRDWQRARTFETAADAEADLQELVNAGVARWEQPASSGGPGRPKSRLLVLLDAPDDRTPRHDTEKGVLSVSEVAVAEKRDLGPLQHQEPVGENASDKTPIGDSAGEVLSVSEVESPLKHDDEEGSSDSSRGQSESDGAIGSDTDETQPTPPGEGVLSQGILGADSDGGIESQGAPRSDTDRTHLAPPPGGVLSDEDPDEWGEL